ncbi:hypothetical protein LTR10_006199 [Elasticomyces elasticus]|nr:hypothetical protein LTR10_006199 [Elasticomyces elasticus]KAK4966752.1 hypothetical protein LTR42_011063 [Elasticomyces elasticus]
MPTYHYKRLASSRPGTTSEFRILTILHGATSEKLRCTLTHHSLPTPIGNGEEMIDYEALSWTWGSGEDSLGTIFIVDGGQERTLAVKGNLFEALVRLRGSSTDRAMWVDYVCIDQSELEEKSLQVKLMKVIYSNASNVCIWLGEHENDSQRAFTFIKQEVCNLRHFERITDDENTKDDWKALAAVMDRDWFSRRWVVQELALARRATVHCGDDILDWTKFETAVTLFVREAPRLAGFYQGSKQFGFDHDFFGDVEQMGATRLVRMKGSLFRCDDQGHITQYRYNLFDLVSHLSSFTAKEPHDTIYAILSLARDTRFKLGPINDMSASGRSSHAAPKADVYDSVPLEHPEQHDDHSSSSKIKHQRDAEDTQQETCTKKVKTAFESVQSDLTPAKLNLVRSAVDKLIWSTLPKNSQLFIVDYDQDFFRVCKQFLQLTVPNHQTNNLDILLRPWAPQAGTTSLRDTRSLPSWIPTLEKAAFKRMRALHAPGQHKRARIQADPLVGQTTFGTQTSYYNASRCPRAILGQDWWFGPGPDDRSLFVNGFVLDRIGQIEAASQNGNISAEWLELGGVSATNDFRDEFCRTLVADRASDGKSLNQYFLDAFKDAAELSTEGIHVANVKQPGHPILVEVMTRMEAVVWNRKLFRSRRRNDLGLAPKSARQGDYICIIKGISVPVVMRQEAKHYVLIGECYLHAMMDGGAIDVQEDMEDRNAMSAEEKELGLSHIFELR